MPANIYSILKWDKNSVSLLLECRSHPESSRLQRGASSPRHPPGTQSLPCTLPPTKPRNTEKLKQEAPA